MAGATFSTRITIGRNQDGVKFNLVAIDTNRERMKQLAYEFLAIAHSNEELDDTHLHVHVTDDTYAEENNALALIVHLNDHLSNS